MQQIQVGIPIRFFKYVGRVYFMWGIQEFHCIWKFQIISKFFFLRVSDSAGRTVLNQCALPLDKPTLSRFHPSPPTRWNSKDCGIPTAGPETEKVSTLKKEKEMKSIAWMNVLPTVQVLYFNDLHIWGVCFRKRSHI